MSTLSTVKLDLSQPDKFQMASIVTKNSRTGITSNKRLLAIRKGYLYYYSNVPKKFKGDSSILQTIHQLPKCSIQIGNIKQIKGYEGNSSCFSIQFQAKSMLQRQDIRKTMTLEEFNFSPKNTKENIIWQFTCDNQFIKQRWVASLQGLQAHEAREKKDIEKFFNEHKSMDGNCEMKSSSSGRNSQVPWRQSQSFNRNSQVNYLQLASSKGKDQRPNNSLASTQHKLPKSNYLEVVNSNFASRQRVISDNKQDNKKPQFMKQYSPNIQRNIQQHQNDPLNNGKVDLSFEESLEVPSARNFVKSAKDTSRLENSPINELQLSDMKGTSPTKQSNPLMFSKTQKIIIGSETIQEEQSQYNKSPAQSPVRALQLEDVFRQELDENDANEFQLSILENQTQNLGQLNKTSQQENVKNQATNAKELKLFTDSQIKGTQDHKTLKVSKQQLTASKIQRDFEDQGPLLKDRQVGGTSANNQKGSKGQQPSLQPTLQAINQLSFYSLHSYLFSKQLSFSRRIQVQKLFHTKIHHFASQSTNYLVSYIQSLHQGTQADHPDFQIIYKTNSNTLIRHQASATWLKIAFVTSQPLSISGRDKVFFDEQAIKNLKRQFKLYNDLEKFVVLNHVKTDASCKLRLPLTALIQYKGLVALAIDQSYLDQQSDIRHSVHGVSIQIKNKYSQQIEIITNQGYEIKDFALTSEHDQLIINLLPQIVSNRMCKQQAKKAYLKRLLRIKRAEKHHNIELNPPFTQDLIQKAQESNASTSIQSMQHYMTTLSKIVQFKGICPKEQIIQIFKICVFCKHLRKVYRSAQGQIEQTHFLNLIFKGDKGMIKMLQESGCDEVPQLKGVLFTFINHYLGISCTLNEKALKQQLNVITHLGSNSNSKTKKTEVILSTQIKPKIRTYDISKLELHQTCQSLKKFILQQKISLTVEALKILETFHLEQLSGEFIEKRLLIIYYQASLAYLEHDYLKCIQSCRRYESLIQHLNPKLFFVYLLMLKSYSHFSDDQFKSVLQKIIKLVEFNYGPNNSILISVYCISSYYFSQMSQRGVSESKLSNQLFLLSCKLLQQALNLSFKYFGEDSNQYIDILLDLAKVYENNDRLKSLNYSDRAKTIIMSTNNKQKLIDYLIFELKQSKDLKQYQKCKSILNQSQELIYANKLKLDTKKLISLIKIKFELGMLTNNYQLSEQAVQEMWENGKIQAKRESVIMTAKLCKKLKLIEQQQYQQMQYSTQNIIQASSFSSSLKLPHHDPIQDILNLLSQSGYSQGQFQGQTLLARIKQLIQQEKMDKKDESNHQGIERWLLQIG